MAAALSFVVYWLSLECYDDQAQVPAIFQKLSSTCDFLEDDCSFSSIYSRRYNVNVKGCAIDGSGLGEKNHPPPPSTCIPSVNAHR